MSALDEAVKHKTWCRHSIALIYICDCGADKAASELAGLRDSHKILEGELAYQEETVLPKLRGRKRDLESAAKSAVGVMRDAVDQGDQGAKEWLRKWEDIIYKETE
jgi:hypothetical protein